MLWIGCVLGEGAVTPTHAQRPGFFELNRRVCERLAEHLPHTRVNAFGVYERLVLRELRSSHGATVVDIGSGATCPYAVHKSLGAVIVALDIAVDPLRANVDVDARVVADASYALPLSDESIDVLTSRSVLEHIGNVDRLVAESARVLRPGGVAVHLFSCRGSWFARINRMLGEERARRLLYSTHPESRQVGGFPARYQHCTVAEMSSAHRVNGLKVADAEVFYGTNYAYFFIPAFILISLYEIALQTLNLRNLAATIVLTAQKPASDWRDTNAN